MIHLTANEFQMVVDYVYTHYGIDLRNKQFLIESRLSVECFKRHIDTFRDFWMQMQGVGGMQMQQLLINILTTNHTYFYREEQHFQFLKELLASKELPVDSASMRIWSAGCSSGQEPYTVAMALEESRARGIMSVPYHILATDVSSQAIAQAQKGKYTLADFVRLPKLWQSSYCLLVPGGFEVKRALRANVEFRQANLLMPLGFYQTFDLIMCRNVMIYFDEASRKKLLEILYNHLAPGGYLFVGLTEMLGQVKGFRYVRASVYQKCKN